MNTRTLYLVVGIAVIGLLVLGLIVSLNEAGDLRPASDEIDLPPLAVLEKKKARTPRPLTAETANQSVGTPSTKSSSPEAAQPTAEPTPIVHDDQRRLEDLTAAWIYRGYVKAATRKIGTFLDQDMDETFRMAQGDNRGEVNALNLNSVTAVLGLGSATTELSLISDEMIEMTRQRATTDEQRAIQKKVYEAYYARRHRKSGREYQEQVGTRMPRMPSDESTSEAVKRYMETHYKKFSEEAKDYQPRPGEIMPEPVPNEWVEQQYFENYLKKELKRRGLPLPTMLQEPKSKEEE